MVFVCHERQAANEEENWEFKMATPMKTKLQTHYRVSLFSNNHSRLEILCQQNITKSNALSIIFKTPENFTLDSFTY